MSIRPATATIFLKCDYWPMADKSAKEDETAKDRWFEFISVHYSKFSNSWTLCAPMSLRPIDGYGLPWEDEKHETFEGAVNAAVSLALAHQKHIVVCSDPATGYDLQPNREINNGIFVPA